uniref:CHK kinase-like domain-containing protein n=1 Tax=Panagrolaimus superbus TaxID=310955 RepID=A0A914YCP2_9BILA
MEVTVIEDGVDLAKKIIFGHSFNIGWLLKSLRENDLAYKKLHGNRGVKNVTASNVSAGKGFLSTVLRCTVTFVDTLDIYTTILKIPVMEIFPKGDNEKLKLSFIDCHKSECDFYNKLAPILDIPVPKVYKTVEWILDKQEGCVHMEDLTLRGKCLVFYENINLTQVKCMIRHLAHMHKNVFSADPNIWKGEYLKRSKGLFDALDMFNASVDGFLEKCNHKQDFLPMITKYHKLCRNTDFYLYTFQQAHKDLKMPSVIVHGDMHPGNIMWSLDENGDVQNDLAALVDWHLMHEGSPMSDLAQFLVLCCDGIVRRQAETFAIEYYFKCLVKEFGGDASKVPYTIEQLKKAYNYAYLTRALYIIGVMEYFVPGIEAHITDESIKAAFYESGALRSLHALQDADKLLQGELNDLFVKFSL